MPEQIEKLFNFLVEENEKELMKKIAILFYKYSSDNNIKKFSQEVLIEKMEIDVNELESLVNPKKFDFPEPDIGLIGAPNEEIS